MDYSPSTTPLHDAAQSDNVEGIRDLLKSGECKVNCTDSKGNTPLHYACAKGHLGTIWALLSNKADVTAKDKSGRTPIMLAAKNGNNTVVCTLMKDYGCLGNIVDSNGNTVLHYACYSDSITLVRFLIKECSADVSARNKDYDTPLLIAASSGRSTVMDCLIREFNCDTDVKGWLGRSLLHNACKTDNVDLVQNLILEHKADVRAKDDANDTPLHIAAESGSENVALLLINSFGCDVKGRGSMRRNLLHKASMGGCVVLVKTLIRQFKANVGALDQENDTPLTLAALSGRKTVVFSLINDFGCSVATLGSMQGTLLHHACESGNMELVRALIMDHNADTTKRNAENNTALHVAALCGNTEVTLSLIDRFQCDPKTTGWLGRSTLHLACIGGNVTLVRTLIQDYKLDIDALDENGDSILHLAVLYGREEVVMTLIKQFGLGINIRGNLGNSVLHQACKAGNLNIVRALIKNYNADINDRDMSNNTPADTAALNGRDDVVLALVDEFGYDINSKGALGGLLLHQACIGGHLGLIRALILKHKANINAINDDGYTPLQVAALTGRDDVVTDFIETHNCDISIKDSSGKSLLHLACRNGSLPLVQKLIQKYKLDPTLPDCLGDTPLHIAAMCGKEDAIFYMINEIGCDCNITGSLHRTLLHQACRGGCVNLVRNLIEEHNLDINAHDQEDYTPFHMAALFGREEVMVTLTRDFQCNIGVRGSDGQSLLHLVSNKEHVEAIPMLCKWMPLLIADNEGNTPLHTCSALGNVNSAKALLKQNVPVKIRNKLGKTPRDVATAEIKKIIDGYLSATVSHVDYSALQDYAKKKYCATSPLQRVFIVGDSGTGKTSLIRSLKGAGRKGISVIPTAAIDFSIHTCKQFGRTLYYDLSGGLEYHASHSAILDTYTTSNIGDNIFIIVVDLRQTVQGIKDSLYYWFLFIMNQNYYSGKGPHICIVGSHSDLVQSKQDLNEKTVIIREIGDAYDFQKGVSSDIQYFMLHCSRPRPKTIQTMQRDVASLTGKSLPYDLSLPASILLGLLERDFVATSACSINVIISRIQDSGIYLPTNAASLYPFFAELHAVGVLFLAGDATDNDLQVVLNINQFLTEVHEILFSSEAVLKRECFSNNVPSPCTGIIPEKILCHSLKDPGTKECLLHLQYCVRINHNLINYFYSKPQSYSIDSSRFLLFPALCSLEKRDVLHGVRPLNKYHTGYGWLAQCSDIHKRFPQRFMHILQLKIISSFTVKSCGEQLDVLPKQRTHQHYCAIWKTGLRFMTEEGVECTVEMVNWNNGVVIITKGEDELTNENCIYIFRRIVGFALEIKSQFCHFIKPQFFLLDTTDEAEFFLRSDNLHLFNDVEKILLSPSGHDFRKVQAVQKYTWLQKYTLWNCLFNIDILSILKVTKTADSAWLKLIAMLGLSPQEVNSLTSLSDNPSDSKRQRTEILHSWIDFKLKNSKYGHICWQDLVSSLEQVGNHGTASAIIQTYGI